MYYQYCPDTDSKQCIKQKCPAFTYSKPYLWECKICKEQHHLGGTCSSKDHVRSPIFIQDFPYCKRYNKQLTNYSSQSIIRN